VSPHYVPKGAKIPSKFLEFLRANKLLSETPVEGVRRSGGGNIQVIRKAVGDQLVDAFLTALKNLEAAMETKKFPIEIQVAYKSVAVNN